MQPQLKIKDLGRHYFSFSISMLAGADICAPQLKVYIVTYVCSHNPSLFETFCMPVSFAKMPSAVKKTQRLCNTLVFEFFQTAAVNLITSGSKFATKLVYRRNENLNFFTSARKFTLSSNADWILNPANLTTSDELLLNANYKRIIALLQENFLQQ